MKKSVLFLCTGNSCRSQMAGAFAQHYAGDRIDVTTGGSQPVGTVNPIMVEVMQEKGIDMAFRGPQTIESALGNGPPATIVTMGCGEACPHVPGARMLDWDLPDPSDQGLEAMRKLRDLIEENVKKLVREFPKA